MNEEIANPTIAERIGTSARNWFAGLRNQALSNRLSQLEEVAPGTFQAEADFMHSVGQQQERLATEYADLAIEGATSYGIGKGAGLLGGIIGKFERIFPSKNAAQAEKVVIGRGTDLANPGALKPGEFKLEWPSKLPDFKAEWKMNSGLLRKEMGKGLPIRDASPGNTGGLFLNAERKLLESRGWSFDSKTNYWMPPGTP